MSAADGDSHPHIDPEWYEHAFGDLYNVIYAHRTVEAAKPEAMFAARALDLKPTSRLLDLCCGSGRHLVHLASVTPRVVGLDYSLELLDQARRLLDGRARVVRADMRKIPFRGAFDAVTNFFTSFGYFIDDEENLAVAKELESALVSGGCFFIDYVNAVRLQSTLQAETDRCVGDCHIRERRWIDEAARRVNKLTRLERNGRTIREFSESVRLYTAAELRALLDAAGLQIDTLYGSYEGDPFHLDSPRMIVVGSKCR